MMPTDLPPHELQRGARLVFKSGIYPDTSRWSAMHGLQCTVVRDFYPEDSIRIAERPLDDSGVWPRRCFVLNETILDRDLYDDVMKAYDAMQALGG